MHFRYKFLQRQGDDAHEHGNNLQGRIEGLPFKAEEMFRKVLLRYKRPHGKEHKRTKNYICSELEIVLF